MFSKYLLTFSTTAMLTLFTIPTFANSQDITNTNSNGRTYYATSKQVQRCQLNKYYKVKGTPYQIAVEKYKDGMIRFKAKQMQKTFLYLAVPLSHEFNMKIKDRMNGMGGWVEVCQDVYVTGSLVDRMVKTACAIAREAGINMSADEVGDDVISFEFE